MAVKNLSFCMDVPKVFSAKDFRIVDRVLSVNKVVTHLHHKH